MVRYAHILAATRAAPILPNAANRRHAIGTSGHFSFPSPASPCESFACQGDCIVRCRASYFRCYENCVNCAKRWKQKTSSWVAGSRPSHSPLCRPPRSSSYFDSSQAPTEPRTGPLSHGTNSETQFLCARQNVGGRVAGTNDVERTGKSNSAQLRHHERGRTARYWMAALSTSPAYRSLSD